MQCLQSKSTIYLDHLSIFFIILWLHSIFCLRFTLFVGERPSGIFLHLISLNLSFCIYCLSCLNHSSFVYLHPCHQHSLSHKNMECKFQYVSYKTLLNILNVSILWLFSNYSHLSFLFSLFTTQSLLKALFPQFEKSSTHIFKSRPHILILYLHLILLFRNTCNTYSVNDNSNSWDWNPSFSYCHFLYDICNKVINVGDLKALRIFSLVYNWLNSMFMVHPHLC